MSLVIPSPATAQVLFGAHGRDVETGLFALPERPPASLLADLRQGLRLMARDLERLKDAGAFAEQVPYGPDSHTRRAAEYFDQHFAKSYLELSATGVMAWLADVMSGLRVNVCRTGKDVISEEWVQHLKALGEGLLERWLVILAEETPIFLRPIVNRSRFQRHQLTHVRKNIALGIESLKPLVPSSATLSAPNRDAAGGPEGVAAAQELLQDPTQSAVGFLTASPSPASDQAPLDLQNKAKKRRKFVIPRRESKGWHSNEDWADAIHERHLDKPISSRTLYNYLSGRTDPNRTTRELMADSLDVAESELPL